MISLKEVIKICELIFPDYVVASGDISCIVYDRGGAIIAQLIELIDSQIQGRVFFTNLHREVYQRLREVFTITCKDVTSNYGICFYITGIK